MDISANFEGIPLNELWRYHVHTATIMFFKVKVTFDPQKPLIKVSAFTKPEESPSRRYKEHSPGNNLVL